MAYRTDRKQLIAVARRTTLALVLTWVAGA
jgi:hypothetical protein